MSEYGEGVGEQVEDTTVAFGELKWAKLPGDFWWPGQVVDENTVSENKISGKKSSGQVLVRLYGTYNYSYIDPIKSELDFAIISKQQNGSHRQIFQQSLEKDLSLNKPRGLKRRGSESKTNARMDTYGGKNSGKRSRVKRASSSTPKKKLRVDSSSKARTKSVGQDMLPNKAKPRQTCFDNGVKTKTRKDEDQTAHKHSKEEKKRRKSAHGGTCNEIEQNTIEENPRKKTPKRSELNNGSSLETTQVQKCEQQSGRRVKVMQNLGLIAPCGSPFSKNDRTDLPS